MPPDAPSALERRLGQLLSLGVTGIGAELAGALLGDVRAPWFATGGLWLTLASAATFVGNLVVVAGAYFWRRWREGGD